jgi:hypothetical protein
MMLPSLELTATAPPPAIVCQLSSAQVAEPIRARFGYRIAGNGVELKERTPDQYPVVIWEITSNVPKAGSGDTAEIAINDFFVGTRYLLQNEPVTWMQVSSRAAADKPSVEWWATVEGDEAGGASVGLGSIVDQIAVLSDGWAGAGSVAPSTAARSDVAAALAVAPAGTRAPTIEVDEDGVVALLWEGADKSFALTFYGNGMVVGTLSPYAAQHKPWRVNASDSAAISSRLLAPELTQLLS